MTDAKKSNIIYIIVLSVSILFIGFFFAFSNQNKRENETLDYDKVFDIESYNVKISNCIYSSDSNKISFRFKCALKDTVTEPINKKPEIKSITLIDKDGKKVSINDFTQQTVNNEETKVTLNTDEFDFVCMRIDIYSKNYDYKDEDTYDEFGDKIEGQYHEGKELNFYVVIDIEDMIKLSSEEFESYKPPKTVTTTTETTTTTPETTISFQMYVTTTTSVMTKTSSITTKAATSVSIESNNESNVGNGGGNNHQNGGSQAVAQPSYDDNNYQTQSQQTQQQPATPTQKPQTTKKTTQAAVVHPNAISLDTGFSDNNVKLSVGNSHMISAVIKPDNATKSVTWESNRADIATIDETGKIIAISKGKAIITAKTKDGDLCASCMVTVS